jgi:hypothetical protein
MDLKWPGQHRYFGGGSDVPAVPPPPNPTNLDVQKAAQKALEADKRRKGRSATILTGPEGVMNNPSPQKTLLGS